jgi:anaerobic dimethyl sulfoxide reductase subunit A
VQGFDEATLPASAPPGASYRSYLLGLADGVKKTPEWAAEITGIPAATIRRLALDYDPRSPRRCTVATLQDARFKASSSTGRPMRSRR